MGGQNKILGRAWPDVVSHDSCGRMEGWNQVGGKVFLLFPYPEDKCFETHGRTHSS